MRKTRGKRINVKASVNAKKETVELILTAITNLKKLKKPQADVGIAIGNGTDIAIESADIILTKNDITDVVKALKISRATIRNVKQNLFWAFIYNIIGIPVACGVFYPVNKFY